MKLRNNIWGWILAFLFLGNFSLFGQEEAAEEAPGLQEYLLVHFSYSYQNPAGDLKKRYGWNSTAGLGFDYLTTKNFIFGLQGDFLFGRKVKEDVLANLRNSEGQLIGNNRSIANINLTQRGLNLNVLFGKLIPFRKENPRSGIRITAGLGFLQHKIRIQQDAQSLVPQTTGDYGKGYDRLTNGFALTEFIGYQKISENKKINLMIGLEFVQGFTANQRSFDYDRRAQDTKKYIDVLIGAKIAWTLPFEIGKSSDEIFY